MRPLNQAPRQSKGKGKRIATEEAISLSSRGITQSLSSLLPPVVPTPTVSPLLAIKSEASQSATPLPPPVKLVCKHMISDARYQKNSAYV